MRDPAKIWVHASNLHCHTNEISQTTPDPQIIFRSEPEVEPACPPNFSAQHDSAFSNQIHRLGDSQEETGATMQIDTGSYFTRQNA